MGEIEHALHAKAITLHSRIKGGGDLRRRGQRVSQVFRHHAWPYDSWPIAAAPCQDSLRCREQTDDQEGNLEHDRRRLPQLRSEGDRHLLRQDHGARFREAFKAGISFGKDDMVVPETKPRIIAETGALAKEIRAAV